MYFNHVEEYDITEFVFYSLAPLVFWQAARMWRRDSQVVRDGFANTADTVKAKVKEVSGVTLERELHVW